MSVPGITGSTSSLYGQAGGSTDTGSSGDKGNTSVMAALVDKPKKGKDKENDPLKRGPQSSESVFAKWLKGASDFSQTSFGDFTSPFGNSPASGRSALPTTPTMPISAAMSQELESKYSPMIREIANNVGVREDILTVVVRQESNGNPNAVSVKGAMGLAQLMPKTAEQYGVTDPMDPKQNLTGAAKYLRDLLNKYHGDVALALAAYNAGPGKVDKCGGIPNIPETMHYVAINLKRLGMPADPRVHDSQKNIA